ncbi:MAG: hypothetical protein E7A50_08035 [Clostridiales bacterium]|nr:hypothetical protein [Clostridiales bacterium]
MVYAQINKDKICVGISQLNDVVQASNLVELEDYDLSVLGKKYEDGEWQDVPKDPTPPEPTQDEILQEKLSRLSDKLDRQSAALLQIGMSVVKPPDASEIPEVPPVPPAPTNPTGAPPVPDGMPDAETLKKLMGTS